MTAYTFLFAGVVLNTLLTLSIASEDQLGSPDRPEYTNVDEAQYCLIIDAGSSGSRLRMYNKTQDGGMTQLFPSNEDDGKFETEPGISSYADSPGDVGESLHGLLDAAAKYIPKSHYSRTPLWVKATAGMRLVPREKLNKIFSAVDEYLGQAEHCPFKFVTSEVLGGEEEAVFAWISINSLLKNIFKGPQVTSGVLDMGGASMQVAFNPGTDIMANEFSMYVNRSRLSVYAKSFIQFGLATAVDRAKQVIVKKHNGMTPSSSVDFPCLNKGFSELTEIEGKQVKFVGSGKWESCADIIQGLLHTDSECLMEPCAIMGEHMSAIQPFKTFYGLANFFYISNGLGLLGWDEAKVLTPKSIEEATRFFCGKDLEHAKAATPTPWKYKKYHCFGGLYMTRILKAYGIPEDSKQITFARKIRGQSADWSLGAALYETQYMPVKLQTRMQDCACAKEELMLLPAKDRLSISSPITTLPVEWFIGFVSLAMCGLSIVGVYRGRFSRCWRSMPDKQDKQDQADYPELKLYNPLYQAGGTATIESNPT